MLKSKKLSFLIFHFFPVPRTSPVPENPGTGKSKKPVFARLQNGVFFTFFPVPRSSPVPENPGTGKSEKPVFARLQKISYRNSKILVLGYRRKNFKTRFLPVSCSVEKYVILLL